MTSIRWYLSIALMFVLSLTGVALQLDETSLRKSASEAQASQNWLEAFDMFKKLLADPSVKGLALVGDLKNAFICLQQLNRIDDLDEQIKTAIETHPDDWRIHAAAAQIYLGGYHYGIVSDGKFYRQPNRQLSGTWVSVNEQDRLQMLRWLEKARVLAEQAQGEAKPSAEDLALLYRQYANALWFMRVDRQAWRLQELTDIEVVPNYTELDFSNQGIARYAPVDEAGNPILYATPKQWSEAKSDGERIRWLVLQANEMHRPTGLEMLYQWANFLNTQFSVDTLSEYRWIRQSTGDSKDDTSDRREGIYSIHTLKENETIARLANGVKRFELSDEHNPIAIYRSLTKESDPILGEAAFTQLANTFLNRRQYPEALKATRDSVEKYGDSNALKKTLIESITEPRGTFDPLPAQEAGKGVTLSLLFRNATSAEFTAQQVDLEKIFAEIKKFYRDTSNVETPKFSGSPNQYPPPIKYPAELFSPEEYSRFAKGPVSKWNLALEPRANHWDRRVDVASPVQEPGLYVVTVKFDGGRNTARTLVWVQDTAVIRKPLSEKVLYFVADASSGKPLAGMNVEFFGQKVEYRNDGRKPVWIVKNFAKKTDAEGSIALDASELPADYQWSVVARDGKKRAGFLGFESMWYQRYAGQSHEQIVAYGVSDRPAYRPGDVIRVKFWLGRASYVSKSESAPIKGTTVFVQLTDPKGQLFWQGNANTDQFGGVDFEIPTTKAATLGPYYFSVRAPTQGDVSTELRVRVEEYRKPEFEVSIESPSEPVKLGDKIDAKIRAKYYFGSPVSGASATIRVQRSAFTDNYYPYAPFDWCYGPGYWWYAPDAPWYPGWSRWAGCRVPFPWWYPSFGNEPPELVLEQEVKLDASGEAIISIDTALAKQFQSDQDHQYSISVDVRDASRRTISATGEVIAAREPFKIYTWVDRGFYEVGQPINASFQARTLSGKPVQGSGELRLLQISYDKDGKPVEKEIQKWSVETNEEGLAQQRIEATRGGQYRLQLKLTDKAEHEVEGGYLLTIRGRNEATKDFHYSALELIPDKATYAPGEKLRLQINAEREDATVLLFLRPSNGVYSKPQLVRLTQKSTIVEIPVNTDDQPNFFVEATTIYGAEVHQVTREIIVPPENRVLNVTVKANKSEYLPGEEAEIELQVTDPSGEPVEGSTALAVYDRSLDAIAPDVLPRDIREVFWKWRRSHQPTTVDNLSLETSSLYLSWIPAWSPLGIFGDSLADDADLQERFGANVKKAKDNFSRFSRANGRMSGGGPGGFGGMAGGMGGFRAEAMAASGAPGAPMSKMSLLDASGEAQSPASAGAEVKPAVRKDFADAALWLTNLKTDSNGKATAKFKMPENLTSWQFRSWAVGSGVRVGSATTQATTRKNLLVRLQAPRFLVERDEIVLSALVNNDLPDEKQVRVSLDIENELLLSMLDGVQKEQTVSVPSKGQVRVDWRCKAVAEGEVKLRVSALTDVESDAMELKLPIIVNGFLKTDSWAGTVRGDRTRGDVSIQVPELRRVEQSRLLVRLSPSLAASMIDALPYLAEYPYGCTEQTLNRFLPTVITQKVLQNMQVDLASLAKKRNNLNAQEIGDPAKRAEQWKRFDRSPVYDEAVVKSMVDDGLRRLTDMQNQDGGWGWFSGAYENSYPHTTAVVVRGLLIARDNDVAIVPDVLERGLNWLAQYQAQELQKLKNAATETLPYKSVPDNLDALVFHILTSADRPNAEMQEFLYTKREGLSVYGKSLLALSVHKLGNQEQTNMLRRNIEQFLVQDTENETAYLRDQSPWWYWYGSEIEAAACYLKLLSAIDPSGPTAPRVVKHLLNNRKNSTYWNSTRDTALVIEAFSDYLRATGETKTNVTAEVWLDDKKVGSVEFTPENMFEVDNTIELVGNAVPSGKHRLEVRRQGGGAIYWNAYLTNFTLEDEIPAAGLEVKVERRYYRIDRSKADLTLAGDRGQVVDAERTRAERITLEELKDLPSGSVVEVELLLESKNDYEYLIVEDRKPACLEAIDTQSGYYSNGGLFVYRELRDQKVAFFFRQLGQGKHSLRYQLRAEAPGRFTALPAQIQGMYAPELVGNSADFDISVAD